MRRNTTWILTFFLLLGAACMGAVCFHSVAQVKGINDVRAMQVSVFYAVQLALVWLVGCWACRRGYESTQRKFMAGCWGVFGETAFAGPLTVALAHTDMLINPPRAWLWLWLVGAVAFFVAASRRSRC